MSSATFTSAPVHAVPLRSTKGDTSLGAAANGSADAPEHRHALGNALRAVKVFTAAAFSVVVMGEYTER
ncbi:hypothetical protein ACFC0M_19740 [Streptomyces sp. NPDC056149]|uniref:hypothetical protein n=1 Tax=unclassified Streptomyces TaxID=2593676 RepID=UPI0023817B90|nr:hypothetical protein [Streptomyces sp. WZ-12]